MKRGFLSGSKFGDSAPKSERQEPRPSQSTPSYSSAQTIASDDEDSDEERLKAYTGLTEEEKDEIRQSKVQVKKFVKQHPLQSLGELTRIMQTERHTGKPFDNPIYTKAGYDAMWPDEKVYPAMQRIYNTAALNRRVAREAGEEINKIGGFRLMRGVFYMLSNASALSLAGAQKEDPDQTGHMYRELSKRWDGVGEWRH